MPQFRLMIHLDSVLAAVNFEALAKWLLMFPKRLADLKLIIFAELKPLNVYVALATRSYFLYVKILRFAHKGQILLPLA